MLVRHEGQRELRSRGGAVPELPDVNGAERVLASTKTDELRKTLIDGFRPMFDGVQKTVLFGWQANGNPGDALIWQGQLALLEALGIEIVAVGGPQKLDEATLRNLDPDVAVTLSGGGNFGDLWPTAHEFRESVLRASVGRRLIQFPQSFCFQNPGNADGVRKLLSARPDTVLTWRDERSLVLARELFEGTRCELLPDASLAVRPMHRSRPAKISLLGISRSDHEASGLHTVGLPGGVQTDWVAHQCVSTVLRRLPAWGVLYLDDHFGAHLPQPSRAALYRVAADVTIDCGTELVSQGQVVVSDRLHVHIFCMLLGIDHVMVDTLQGKISSFIRTWTAGVDCVHLADSPASAVEIAQSLLG
jgi:pyruvyl transferase EpsO